MDVNAYGEQFFCRYTHAQYTATGLFSISLYYSELLFVVTFVLGQPENHRRTFPDGQQNYNTHTCDLVVSSYEVLGIYL
jgi:hypothetical protein